MRVTAKKTIWGHDSFGPYDPWGHFPAVQGTHLQPNGLPSVAGFLDCSRWIYDGFVNFDDGCTTDYPSLGTTLIDSPTVRTPPPPRLLPSTPQFVDIVSVSVNQ